MPSAAGLVLALLTFAPAEAPAVEPGEVSSASSTPPRFITCMIPDDFDYEAVTISPGGYAVDWRPRPGPKLELRVRTSFFAILVDRSAGM